MPFSAKPTKKHEICVAGWTNLSHSFSIIAQNVIVELFKTGQFDLHIYEPPFPVASWEKIKKTEGWDNQSTRILESISRVRSLQEIPLLNFSYPFEVQSNHNPQLRFLITEFGLVKSNWKDISNYYDFLNGEEKIFTTSLWSKERLIEDGFTDNRIDVIPCGYNPSLFYPFASEKRNELRHHLGFSEDDLIVLNVSAMTWNKGIDLLVLACYELWKKSSKVKVILKDSRFLYGLSAQDIISSTLQQIDADPSFLQSIKIVGDNLPAHSLAGLYNMCDLYLSPYRAEGFNLPALEAAACGANVLCTGGGPTDEFLPPESSLLSSKVSSDFFPASLSEGLINPTKHFFLECKVENIVDASAAVIFDGHHINYTGTMLDKFSWSNVVTSFYSPRLSNLCVFSNE